MFDIITNIAQAQFVASNFQPSHIKKFEAFLSPNIF